MNFFEVHLPKEVDKELVDYVENVALRESRYIFTRRAKNFQFGYCTHCKREFLTKGFRHGSVEICEKCGSFCTVKASGRGRSRLVDEAYVIWYSKSVADPSALVARGVYVQRDYTGDYKNVNTEFRVQAEYVFQPGNYRATGKARFGSARMQRRGIWDLNMTEPASIISERDNSMRRPPFYLSKENIASAVKGTVFQYCGWEKFLDYRKENEWVQYGMNGYERRAGEPRTDMVKFFSLAAKYPCVEYLVKLGFENVIENKINGWGTYDAVNFRGTTIEKVLRLSKQEIKELKNSRLEITPILLHSYHFHKKKGINLTFAQADRIRDLTFDHNQESLKCVGVSHSIIQTVKYFIRQLERPDASRWYSDAGSIVRDWRDYLDDCKKLGMVLDSNAVLYPNDLHVAHMKTTEKVKYKEDRKINVQIAKRIDQLSKMYLFSSDDFIIMPAQSSIELFREGKELSHCVGRYAKDYAEGKCDILFVRMASEPTRPFYTMEIQNGKIVQCRGFKNCSMTSEVRSFVDKFIDQKLAPKKVKNSVKVGIAV